MLPPFTDLRSVQTLIDGDKLKIRYGAQDLSPHDSGAYTGEISGPMLAKLGCPYVLVGHSERRQYHGETDELVNAKVQGRLRHGLTPILCVGEEAGRPSGGQPGRAHCLAQLDGGLKESPAEQVASMVIAYEPVWAIGTGEVATPEDAQEVCAAIRVTGLRAVLTPKRPPGPYPVRRVRQVRQRRARSWRSPTSTAPWSAAPASTPDEFVKICRYRELAGVGVDMQQRPRQRAPVVTEQEMDTAMVIGFSIALIIISLLMMLLVLMHKGKGGGLSDLFGGGVAPPSARLRSSSATWTASRSSSVSCGSCASSPSTCWSITRPVASDPAPKLSRIESGLVALWPSRGDLWVVATRSAAAGSARVRWAKPSAARPRRVCGSPSGARTSTRRGPASPPTPRSLTPGSARAAAFPPARTSTPRRPAAHRAVQDAPRVREGAPQRRRRRGDPGRGPGPPARRLSLGRRRGA